MIGNNQISKRDIGNSRLLLFILQQTIFKLLFINAREVFQNISEALSHIQLPFDLNERFLESSGFFWLSMIKFNIL